MSDPKERINDAYAKRYGNTEDPDYDKDWAKNLDNLGFFSITNDEKLNSILKIAPEVAGFAPFNQLIYKKANEDGIFFLSLCARTWRTSGDIGRRAGAGLQPKDRLHRCDVVFSPAWSRSRSKTATARAG